MMIGKDAKDKTQKQYVWFAFVGKSSGLHPYQLACLFLVGGGKIYLPKRAIMEYLAIVNFEKYQHYKLDNPPWIKLYTKLLNNWEFRSLTDESKLVYICCLLVAAMSHNCFPLDIKMINTWAGLDAKMFHIKQLLDKNFLIKINKLDKKPIEQVYNDPKPYTETDSEKRQNRGRIETESLTTPVSLTNKIVAKERDSLCETNVSPRKKAVQKLEHSDHKKFIDWYYETYHQVIGEKMIMDGADAKQLQRALNSVPLEKLKVRAERFFADPESYPPNDKSLKVFLMTKNLNIYAVEKYMAGSKITQKNIATGMAWLAKHEGRKDGEV